jgi:hypothetical protein
MSKSQHIRNIGRTSAVYEVSSGVRSTRNEDGGIVLDIDHGQMFRLNPVGALILELLAKEQSEAEIVEQISRDYCINKEIAVTDVNEFLHSLETNKLVHKRGARTS